MALEADMEPDIDALIADLGDGNGRVRENARGALSRMGVPAGPALVEILGDEDGTTRTSAMNALLTMLDAVPFLIDALDHHSPGVRDGAIWTLTECLVHVGVSNDSY